MNPHSPFNGHDHSSQPLDPSGGSTSGRHQWTQSSAEQQDLWPSASGPRNIWHQGQDSSQNFSETVEDQTSQDQGGCIGWQPHSANAYGSSLGSTLGSAPFQASEFSQGLSNQQYPQGVTDTSAFGFGPMSPLYGAQRRANHLALPNVTTAQHQTAFTPYPSAMDPPPDTEAEDLVEGSPSKDHIDSSSLTKKNWELPPRARPGRKPDTRACDTKRKEQNREAQRAFRERRAAKLEEVKADSARKLDQASKERDLLKREWEVEKAGLWKEIGKLNEQIQKEREARRTVEAALCLERSRHQQHHQYPHQYMHPRWSSSTSSGFSSSVSPWSQLSPTNPGPMPMLPEPLPTHTREHGLPSRACRQCGREGGCHCVESTLARLPDPDPAHGHQDSARQQPMEVDFTRSSHGAPSGTSMESDSCGFCTAPENCLCTDFAQDPPSGHPSSSHSRQTSSASNRPQPLEPSSCAKGPGSCDQCMDDPKRREFCQGLPSPLRTVPEDSTNDQTISCEEAYDLLGEHASNPDVTQALRTMPPDARRRTTGVDVDCADALAMLRDNAHLSNRSPPADDEE